MKKLILVLLLVASSAIAQTLKVTKIKPLDQNKVATTLELHNESNQKIRYVSMYCSYSGFYLTDNPSVKITPRPCDKNFPITATIAPHSYKIVDLDLEILKNTKNAKFKIGFKFTEIPKNLTLADSASIKSITIWSNTIEFKSK